MKKKTKPKSGNKGLKKKLKIKKKGNENQLGSKEKKGTKKLVRFERKKKGEK